MNKPNSDLMTTREVAEKLKVHQRTVQRWIAMGRLHAMKVGPKMWRVHYSDLNAFLKDSNARITKEE